MMALQQQEVAVLRTQIQLTEEQARALKDLAHREGKSVAELTRQAVDYWLQKVGSVSAEERRQRALAVVGRFHSGLSDISERHDDYLAEAYDE
jgi:hypothetical protein